MDYQVVIKTVNAQPLAAVRRRVLARDIGGTWKPALDLVWEFLRRHEGLPIVGHNCFLYHHPDRHGEEIDIYFGVQVVRPFDGEGEVICTETPAGEIAITTHIGGYDKLAGAHEAIHHWSASAARPLAAWSWETYGDWTDDPAKLETQVVYLLR